MTTLDIDRAVTEALHSTLANGGATVSIVTGVPTPTSGYAVSLPGHERVGRITDTHRNSIRLYVATRKTLLSRPGRYLGTWIDEGRLYLDVTEIYPERAVAEHYGAEREQLAIYDLAAGESLYAVTRRVPASGERRVSWLTEQERDAVLSTDATAYAGHREPLPLFEVVGAGTYDATTDTLR